MLQHLAGICILTAFQQSFNISVSLFSSFGLLLKCPPCVAVLISFAPARAR